MEELSPELQAFLLSQPYLQLTDKKRIKCTLNGHEFPCDLAELQSFTNGKKYQKLCSGTEFNYKQYEPHVVQSSKQPLQFFCKLTLRHLNRQPQHVLKHVNGKRFKKALGKYEECMKAGVEYVPARLLNKRPKNNNNNDGDGPKRRETKQKGGMWEPTSDEDDEDASDSEDSLSDLYPSTMFTTKSPEDAMEEDNFQTDDDDKKEEDKVKKEKEEGAMEVENQTVQKRKKEQGGGLHKKFKNNNWRRKKGKAQP